MTKDEWRVAREKAYDAGQYTLEVPAVTTGGWDKTAWCNWVKFNNPILNGFDDRSNVIRIKDHLDNMDYTARITKGTLRTDKWAIFKVRNGFLACLEYRYRRTSTTSTTATQRIELRCVIHATARVRITKEKTDATNRSNLGVHQPRDTTK